MIGRTLTGCTSSPLPGGELAIDFGLVADQGLRLARCNLHHVRNNRDRSCLRDGDDDLVFFLLLDGEATVDHCDERHQLSPGDGMLARFDHTLDTSWPDARLMLMRLDRRAVSGVEPGRAAGRLRSGSNSLMRLLRTYACAAWEEGAAAGALTPMAARHMTELVSAVCAPAPDEALKHARQALPSARLTVMREAIRSRYTDARLSMQQVAAAAGLSERAGYLAFEAAGLSFTGELYAIRLERARERLGFASERVIDVAYGVGFSDISHFHRLFRDRFGCTPGEARAQLKAQWEASPVP